MSEWIEDEIGCGLIVAIIVVALIVAMGFAIYSENKREHAACERAMNMARSSTDSITVIMKCEVKDKQIQPVPYPVYIPSR